MPPDLPKLSFTNPWLKRYIFLALKKTEMENVKFVSVILCDMLLQM